jgi:DNA modification methylase
MTSPKITGSTKAESGKITKHGAAEVLPAASKAALRNSLPKSRTTNSRKREISSRKPIATALAIEQVSTDRLRPNPQNPRQNDVAVEAVARSIQSFGFNSPIITDGDLNIAAGHTRLKAARLLGLKVVPVIRIVGLTGSKFTGFSIADNKTAEIAEWDLEHLNKLIAELNEDIDFDITSLGFDDRELTEILDCSFQDDEARADEAPALPRIAKTKPGDLWLLGDHLLLCGDASSQEHLQRLMEDERIDCLITDPPYGVGYRSRGKKREQWGKIENDNLDVASLESFLRKVFQNVASVCRQGATAYVCHGISAAGIRIAFEQAFVASGFRLSSTIVWVKQSASMGWGDYREQHECLLYGWIGEGHRRIQDRTQTTVWQIDREGDYQHPTQKPVALISRALRNSTVRGERVLDPFAGSGTTLIACEQLGRYCLATEIEPKYCDVIVKRWENYTGKKAKLLGHNSAKEGSRDA